MRFIVCVALVCTGAASFLAGRAAAGAQDVRSRDAEPDYRRVFAQDVVKRLDITMAPADWQTSSPTCRAWPDRVDSA
jgi:hypothetical protein